MNVLNMNVLEKKETIAVLSIPTLSTMCLSYQSNHHWRNKLIEFVVQNPLKLMPTLLNICLQIYLAWIF